MGKLKRGAFHGFIGQVGNLIGGRWKGINYLKLKPESVTDAKSVRQVAQRSRFSGVVQLSQDLMYQIIHPVWNNKAVKMSGFNLFVKENMDAFDSDGQVIDYSMLQLSIGKLASADLTIAATEGVASSVTINWEDNSIQEMAAESDRLRLVVIKEGEKPVLLDAAFDRTATTGTFEIPFATGDQVHLYAFFEDEFGTQHSVDTYQSVVLG